VPERRRAATAPPTTPSNSIQQPSSGTSAQAALPDRRLPAALWGALGALAAISKILSIRVLLLLSGGGAFYIAAYSTNDWLSLGKLITFCLLVVIPLIWLDDTTRRRTELK
jgi:hypothetical protein